MTARLIDTTSEGTVAWQLNLLVFEDDPTGAEFVDRDCPACGARSLVPRRGESFLGRYKDGIGAGELFTIDCRGCGSAFPARVIGVKAPEVPRMKRGAAAAMQALTSTVDRVQSAIAESVDGVAGAVEDAVEKTDRPGWWKGNEPPPPPETTEEDPYKDDLERRFAELERRLRRNGKS